MRPNALAGPRARRASHRHVRALSLVAGVLGLAGCAPGSGSTGTSSPSSSRTSAIVGLAAATAPSPDPRPTLGAGLFDAEEAIWNLRLVSATPPPREFVGSVNSDLAFKDHYAIQGSYNGIQIWDITDPSRPSIVTAYVCPASQSDVSVYGDLLFVSGEGFGGRLDCGTERPRDVVSPVRLRGIRIFDISDITSPRYVGNVQTCRGSHTHTVLEDPDDDENVYIYVSGSAPVRPAEELLGCVGALPEDDPSSALFRIEVIRVPLAAPEQAEIVSSPRIFADLVEPPRHGLTEAELAAVEEARARGAFVLDLPDDQPQVLADDMAAALLDTLVARRGGAGRPTAADSAALRARLVEVVAEESARRANRPRLGPTQCHDITVYPEIGLAGGACEGYGLLIDIRDPVNPRRIDAVSDENFAYWHSATFNNEGTKILFTDEWGGGGAPKCRATDPREWGADAIFAIEDRAMRFHSYYKLPAIQSAAEVCVAHNGSLIPIPGRDVLAQAWYSGGISVFDWTDADHPVEIAYFDRGPVDPDRPRTTGPWSVYWYNGVLVSSEISRGLDVLELAASPLVSQNEIDAAKTVRLDYLNAQGQRRFVWPATFALAGAYLDQIERARGLSASRVASVRQQLADAERAPSTMRRETLGALATELGVDARTSPEGDRVRSLADTVRDLAESGGE